ncbi:MAG: hypothetical protein MMC33_004512 [Icmadophila ericetorum]|nr:hypothetical protein [Icmadophila ericetorum]
MHSNRLILPTLLVFATLLSISSSNEGQQAEFQVQTHQEEVHQVESQPGHPHIEYHATNPHGEDNTGMPPGTHIGIEYPPVAASEAEIVFSDGSEQQQAFSAGSAATDHEDQSPDLGLCQGSRRHRHCMRSQEEILSIGEVGEIVTRGLNKLGEKVGEGVEKSGLKEFSKEKGKLGVETLERILGVESLRRRFWVGRDEL